MDFDFTPEQELIRASYRRFCADTLPPKYARKLDEETTFAPEDLLAKFADLGTFGLTIPEEYGGQGLGMIELVSVMEEISRRSVATAFCVGLPISFGASPLVGMGAEEQKRLHLPRIARGQEKWSLALTEPAGGTDILGAIRTTATRHGDHYIVNGSKQWITGAHKADFLTTVVITDPTAPRKKGLSVLIIDARSPGVTIQPIPKLGIHGCGTNAIFFDDVAVPVEHLLGEENHGWRQLLGTLNPERVMTSVMSLGVAQAAFDYALAYAKERKAFGRPIGGFQILQHYLADIAIEIHAARTLIYRCAWLADQRRPYDVEVAMTKVLAARASHLAACHGMEIMGGYGFAMEYDMQRHFRDYKQMMFSPISDEMAKNYIAESFDLPRSF
jgi:alkylation response protein AidB-like acyl-CoA dehydrogenase